jgi:hypothetical protein
MSLRGTVFLIGRSQRECRPAEKEVAKLEQGGEQVKTAVSTAGARKAKGIVLCSASGGSFSRGGRMLDRLLLLAQSGGDASKWSQWPFGPGYEGGFWWTVSRYLLIAVLLGIIIVVLRIFFGPGGRLRGDIDKDKDNGRQ